MGVLSTLSSPHFKMGVLCCDTTALALVELGIELLAIAGIGIGAMCPIGIGCIPETGIAAGFMP